MDASEEEGEKERFRARNVDMQTQVEEDGGDRTEQNEQSVALDPLTVTALKSSPMTRGQVKEKQMEIIDLLIDWV